MFPFYLTLNVMKRKCSILNFIHMEICYVLFSLTFTNNWPIGCIHCKPVIVFHCRSVVAYDDVTKPLLVSDLEKLKKEPQNVDVEPSSGTHNNCMCHSSSLPEIRLKHPLMSSVFSRMRDGFYIQHDSHLLDQ